MAHKDYYMTLGVLPDAEDIVIKAAYKALVQRYHPDRFKGDAAEAQRRTTELNEAYEVLSNPTKRAEYDRLRASQQNGFTSDFDEAEIESGVDDLNDALKSMDEDWQFALTYYPDLNEITLELNKLSKKLSLAFKFFLLSEKSFDQRKKVAKALEKHYLATYFGSNSEVQALAKRLILDRKIDATHELNKTVSVLGSQSDPAEMIRRIWAKYYTGQTYRYEREKSDLEIKVSSSLQKTKSALAKLLGYSFIVILLISIAMIVYESYESAERKRIAKEQEVLYEKNRIISMESEKRKIVQQIDNGDGTVVDNETGLQWMKCSVGQKWDGRTCIGSASGLSFHEAINLKIHYADKSDWRLPTFQELVTIRFCRYGVVKQRCSFNFDDVAINSNVFPNTPPALYWSLPYKGTNSVRILNFHDGSEIDIHENALYNYDKNLKLTSPLGVRLVRKQ